MKQKIVKHWYWIFAILSIASFILAYRQYKLDEVNPYYQKSSRRCVVIEKYIEQYNANNSRVLDLRNKMILICKTEGIIFPVNVNTFTFYQLNVKDTVYFTLSEQDMYDPLIENQTSRTDKCTIWIVFGVVLIGVCLFIRLHLK